MRTCPSCGGPTDRATGYCSGCSRQYQATHERAKPEARTCGRCGQETSKRTGYCTPCQAEYMRQWRATHS